MTLRTGIEHNLPCHPLDLLDHLLGLPHLPLCTRAELLLGVNHVRNVISHCTSQLFQLPATEFKVELGEL